MAEENVSVGDAYDAETVAEYDKHNPDGPDHDYFRALAASLGARRIADLGCGTGILTVTLAGPGRTVTGIDPSEQMLAYAAARPGGHAVTWLHGTSELLPPERDLVLMTGNVAMHILDPHWHTTVADIATALRPGGVLAFETRNPDAQAWRDWNNPGTTRVRAGRRVTESLTTDPPDADGIVTMRGLLVDDAGDRMESTQRVQFRSLDRIAADLAAAGLVMRAIWQDWQRSSYDPTTTPALMIIEVCRPSLR